MTKKNLLIYRPHVSFSEIQQWVACPYKHKLTYIDNVTIDENKPYFVYGHALHSACEHFLKTKIMNLDIAFDSFEKEWAENVHLESFKKANKKELLDSIPSILNEVPVFMDANFVDWETITAEEELYESIDSRETKFKGYIDCTIKAQGKKDKELAWIIDWKTTSWGWTREKKQDFDTKSQLILYKNFWSKKHNVDPKLIRCAFALLKRSARPGEHCELITVSVGEETTKRALETVDNMLTSLERGITIKNRNSCFKFCDYYDTIHCKW